MLEECSRVFFRSLRKRLPDRLDESLPHPRPRFPPEQILDLRERLLYRIEVRRGVGRQVEDLRARTLDHLSHPPLALVDGEVVHHHHVTLLKRGNEHLAEIALEHSPVGSALDHHRRTHPREAHARESRVVFLPRLRATEQYALAPLGE